MQLNYRGISYDYTPPAVENQRGEFSGRYRGLDWKFCNAPKRYTQQASLDLVYRGVAHNTAGLEVTEPTQVPVISPLVDRTRELMMKHQRSIKNRQQSMLTRLASEVGLPAQDANAYWNRIQGKIHPSFRLTYDRSAASMS